MSSRNSDGNVPKVNWNGGKLYVNWYNPRNANSNLRAREEVSSKGESSMRTLLLIHTLSIPSPFLRFPEVIFPL